MDRAALTEKVTQIFQKYKYVALVVLLGFVLMSIPESETQSAEPQETQTQTQTLTPAEELENILSQIEGVGKVRVMLTESSGSEIWYQTDEDSTTSENSSSLRVETVIISDSDRAEQGLVKRVDPPTYLGAIVVCQGAGRASIQLAIVEAVSNVTGISADRITVLKMK